MEIPWALTTLEQPPAGLAADSQDFCEMSP